MARILVSGLSGPIGTALAPSLAANGAHITRLTRTDASHPAQDEHSIAWNPERPLPADVLSGFDAVVHLAGESIVGRWSDAKKKKIRDSRVLGTRNIAQALAQAKDKPQVFICSSAIGYYGDRGDEVLTEHSSPGSGFLPEVCREWEAATQAAADAGIRTVLMRTGIVLSSQGGALAKMLLPFKMGVGGRIGNGQQWMSWIDIEDMIGAIHHILKSDLLSGPVNMVGPKPVTNEEFTRTLASVLSRPAIFPMPAFAVKLAFGEMGETVLLGSQRVEPTQLVMSGYPFRFRTLRASLENTLKR
jgi:TIGR01777 family protein